LLSYDFTAKATTHAYAAANTAGGTCLMRKRLIGETWKRATAG
jgi:hypothetical protein